MNNISKEIEMHYIFISPPGTRVYFFMPGLSVTCDSWHDSTLCPAPATCNVNTQVSVKNNYFIVFQQNLWGRAEYSDMEE